MQIKKIEDIYIAFASDITKILKNTIIDFDLSEVLTECFGLLINNPKQLTDKKENLSVRNVYVFSSIIDFVLFLKDNNLNFQHRFCDLTVVESYITMSYTIYFTVLKNG